MDFNMSRFDKIAKKWDTKPQRVKTALSIADFISNNISDLDSIDILDYGCGTGLLSFGICENLETKVNSIVGMDSSQGMLDVFVQKAESIGYKNFSTIQNHAEKDSIDGKYNLIVSSMTMHHIKDYKSFIKRCVDSLEDSGYLAIGDISKEDGSFHSDNTGVEHFGFEIDEIREEFEKYLKNVKIEIVETITKNKEYHIFTAIGQKI
jgi:2-polyprenyl-3-methyl-5-hydroxy-6-metoxy-1,4-benzoquinol methylase